MGAENMDNTLFRQRLRSMREQRRISRRVLSELCGLNASAVQRYERGENEPGMSALDAMADYFGCSVDYLMGRKDRD